MVTFFAPEHPYTPIDALNRRAAAMGSPGYAMQAAHADYNGHRIGVGWNSYRGYYIAEYWWAGRVVLCRGSFADCLRAALDEWRRGALGCSVAITPREDDAEALALCQATAELVTAETRDWWTWRHDIACRSARDYANPGMLVRVFDWDLLQAATDEADYDRLVTAKHGRAWA